MTARLIFPLALALAAAPLWAHEIDARALESLPPADVVILGEVHDNPVHHDNQARAVAAIAPRALVLEMLTPVQAARLPVDTSDAEAVEQATGWAESGWPDFVFYHPILMAAPQARIYGAGVTRDEARRAFSQDIAEVFADTFGGDPARFGLTEALAPEDQAAREADQAAAHCNALPDDLLPYMVAAQRLRDAVLAQAALQALEETGGPVAVIAGTGHARLDTGIPAAMRLSANTVTVLSIGQLESAPQARLRFDHWIVTPPVARVDPCAAFD